MVAAETPAPDPAQSAFAFGHDRGSKCAIAVTRYFQMNRSRGGQHGLAAVAVAGVARVIAGWITMLVTEMIGDLDI
jgi:hypothetical protein